MIKSFTIFFGILFTMVINVIFGDGVKVSQNIPSHVNPGDEFTVEITVSKSDVNGFAKIQQELPPGFEAEVVDSKGASFTFNDNKVKFIWMSIPEDEEFTISYKVKVGADVQGKFDIKGKFSYLYNNERKVVDLPVNTISVGEEPETAQKENTPPPTPEVFATRLVEPSGNNYTVTIHIQKENLSGFTKVEELLPEGVTSVKEIDTQGAIFSYVNNKAKFVWMKIPDDNEISVKYEVAGITNPQDLINMSGHVSYLDQEETKRVEIQPAENQPELQPLAQTEQSSTEASEPVSAEEPENLQTSQTEEPEMAQKTTETKEISTSEPQANNNEAISNIPPAETGVTYRVQICAGHEQVNVTEHFKKVYKFEEEPVKLENHEGWLKYTIGSYQIYKNAKERRNDVTARYEFPGPFVTAYNQGKRITVQEALMITHQKWYK
ncbi:MAG: hypothetical protein D6707_01580 [Bacteroidetes bacterium]|nr:MAG: hypothetical protein D6707_01580 [Bacteroidota bacterium]